MLVNEESSLNRLSREVNEESIELFESRIISKILKYLQSSLFEGIGPVMAKRIVSAYGIKTIEIIETSPHLLGLVKGVGPRRIASLKKGWTAQQRIKKSCALLITLKTAKE